MNKALRRPPIRYSAKPLDEYKAKYKDRVYGPATSTLLDVPEAWNLAYLSHDYDTTLTHPDPYFSTNVRRTIQSRLDGNGPDLAGEYPPSRLVQHMLTLTAPRFVHLIRRHPVLELLPMYLAYGPAWVDLIDKRARLITTDHTVYPDIVSLDQAQMVIDRITRMK